jgi:hypothetical protein
VKSFFTAVVTFAAIGSAAIAQTNVDDLHIGSVSVTGSVLERYEAWDWFPAKGESAYGYSGSLLQVAFSQKAQGFDWTIDFAAPILLDLPNHAQAPAPQGTLGLGGNYYSANDKQQFAAMVFPKQAFFRLDGERSRLQMGRFEFSDGKELAPKDETLASLIQSRIAERLIGTFGFSDVRRSFDGLHYDYSAGSSDFTAVAAVPTRGVFQTDGWGWVTTPFAYTSFSKTLSIGKSNAEWRVFGLFYNDDRGIVKTDNSPAQFAAHNLGGIDIGTFGGHYVQAILTNIGIIDLLGWGALQTGKWGSLTQRSGAGSAEAGLQPKILPKLRPWLRAGYFYSTGDNNPNDNVHGTFFAVLYTPRAYARFPFFNEMNNRDLFGEVMLRPRKDLTFRSDVHQLKLASGNDLWYSGGGAYQPWTFGYTGRPAHGATDLGMLYDTSADYQWTKSFSLGLYFGYVQGGKVIEQIYPANSDAKFGFIELNYKF